MFPTAARNVPAKATRSKNVSQPKLLRGRTRPNLPLSSKYKTEMCHYLAEQGRCPFGEQCTYAHSNNELRHIERHPKHKTLPCRDFSTVGFCPFGERCSFIHYKRDPEDILKSSISSDQLNVPSFYSTQSLSQSSLSLSVSPVPDIDGYSDSEVSRLPWPWSGMGIYCGSSFSSGSVVSQDLLQVPEALSSTGQRCGSMSSHSSSSGYLGTPSLSPLCSRSVGTLSRASSISNLSDIAATAWAPTQLQFGSTLAVPGFPGLNSPSISSDDLDSVERVGSTESNPRLPIFKSISTSCDEINFNFL